MYIFTGAYYYMVLLVSAVHNIVWCGIYDTISLDPTNSNTVITLEPPPPPPPPPPQDSHIHRLIPVRSHEYITRRGGRGLRFLFLHVPYIRKVLTERFYASLVPRLGEAWERG